MNAKQRRKAKKMIFKADCGGNNWSIGVDVEESCVVVKANKWPNDIELRLYDILGDDLEKLANAFKAADEYYKQLAADNARNRNVEK